MKQKKTVGKGSTTTEKLESAASLMAKARAKSLTAEQRKDIAKKGSDARWKNKKNT